MLIWVLICKYVDFSQKFPKIPILVWIVRNSRFRSKLSNNLDLGQTYQNIDFSHFFAKNVDLSKNIQKMSIWVKICKYVDFSQNSQKSRFW